MPLLDALRALTSFSPPETLPECDPALLGDVLEAHGLAALASYQLEQRRLGASAPESLRERLLTSFQGVVNDNLLKLMALRAVLRDVDGLRVVLLEAAAYVDWIYPHLGFRPFGDVRLAVPTAEGARFVEATKATLTLVRTEHEARTVVFTNGNATISMQEGLWPSGPEDAPLFERATPYRVFGPSARRPSAEDALLATVAEQALLGLHAPLVTFVDLRELLAQPLDAGYLRARASALRLDRALHGATLLVAHFFPETAEAAAAVRPALGFAERVAVERVVEAAKDPGPAAPAARRGRGGAAGRRAVAGDDRRSPGFRCSGDRTGPPSPRIGGGGAAAPPARAATRRAGASRRGARRAARPGEGFFSRMARRPARGPAGSRGASRRRAACLELGRPWPRDPVLPSR